MISLRYTDAKSIGLRAAMYHQPMSLPLVRPQPWRDPAACFARLAAAHPWGSAFLDSALGSPLLGRYSYVAVDPYGWLAGSGRRFRLGGRAVGDDPFAALSTALGKAREAGVTGLPPFQGGAIGWLGYDLGQRLERLPDPADARRRFDDLRLGLYDTVLAFDHLRRESWLVANGRPLAAPRERLRRAKERIEAWEALLAGLPLEPEREGALDAPSGPDSSEPSATARRSRRSSGPPPVAVTANFSRPAYEAAVQQVIDYILAGDIYQANLAQCFSARLAAGDSPWALYRRLRVRSPAPFAAYLAWGRQVLASASPERFLRLDPDGQVETRPIKGTRPRGSNVAEDRRLAAELLASAKDRAENVMIVDLLRNDISRVCRDHSVDVPALCALESYPAVHHLVSTVHGRLREGLGAADLLRATFPGGSITGAPKIRAMEIIAELEPTRRGPYCGAVAWLGHDGAMDSSIVIRSFTLRGRQVSFQAGGGIVADSDPAAEYDETLTKARALLEAVGTLGRQEEPGG